MAPTALESGSNSRNNPRRQNSNSKSQVKFGKVNQVIDYNAKSGKKISYVQQDSGEEESSSKRISRITNEEKKIKKEEMKKQPWKAGIGSISFGDGTDPMNKPSKQNSGGDGGKKDSNGFSPAEDARMKFFRQKFLVMMQGNDEYIYQTDPGKAANNINDEMMRAILQAKDSARDELAGGPPDGLQALDKQPERLADASQRRSAADLMSINEDEMGKSVMSTTTAKERKEKEQDMLAITKSKTNWSDLLGKFCCKNTNAFNEMSA